MKKLRIILIAALLAIVIAGAAVPYIDAEGYRERIRTALQSSLNRRVKIGKVRFNLFTGPGFSVQDVEIADDPSAGIEPLAYVDSLEARVTLRTLWTRRLTFSNLKLNEPTLNLVRNRQGTWNFQLLHGVAGEFPTIQVRDGRINVKFDDTKSVFYLRDSDIDIDPVQGGRLDIRFSGQPSRTDRAAQSFGLLLARGTWSQTGDAEPQLDFNAELEKSAISELVKLVEGRAIGMHGVVASRAHIAGPISKLAITGDMRLEDVHRWDLLPKGGAWQFKYRGAMDLRGQTLDLAMAENPGEPLSAQFHVSELLARPQWTASVDLHDVRGAAFLEAAKHMGALLPEGVSFDGKLNGSVTLSSANGFQGKLSAQDAILKSPGAPDTKFRSAEVLLAGSLLQVGPSIIEAAGDQVAEVAASYDLDTRELDVQMKTSAMDAGELQKFTGIHAPILSEFARGTWRGWLRYQSEGDPPVGSWSGDMEVRNAAVELAGLSSPVRVASASVALDGTSIVITRLAAHVDDIPFSGEFRREAGKPDRVKLDIAAASLADLERVLAPSLQRKQGLLARFRLRNAPPPEWLRERRVEGSVRIERLTAAEQVWSVDEARLDWRATDLRLNKIRAHRGDAVAEGNLAVRLEANSPHYRLVGRVSDADYKNGTLTFEGTSETQGTGVQLLANARAEGSFEGEDIAFSPEAEFRAISGLFELTAPAKLHLKNVAASQGLEEYTGQGAMQSDGRLLLEMTTGKRQVKLAGSLSDSTIHQ